MKNLFLAATAALAFLASCSTQNDEILASTEGAVVHVSFTDDNGADTRAFSEPRPRPKLGRRH